jgi:hypothetical protein
MVYFTPCNDHTPQTPPNALYIVWRRIRQAEHYDLVSSVTEAPSEGIHTPLCTRHSQLFVICAHLPHATFPPAVTNPTSLTLTSMIVPFVRNPNCVYIGFCGFFLTLMIGSCTVTPNSGCVTFAFLCRKPMGRMNGSYLTGRLVKSGPTNVW